MNRSKFFSTVAALLFAIAGAFAQEKETVFVDASVFPLYGKCIENTSGRYERLPLAYKDISRESLWSLGRNSAGLMVMKDVYISLIISLQMVEEEKIL